MTYTPAFLTARTSVVHTPELAELIRPFVRARFNRVPDPASQYGGFLPRTAAIDIHETGATRFDADIRDVTDEGVSVFFSHRCELVPWLAIRSVTFAALDAAGDRKGQFTVEHDVSELGSRRAA
jgi:hypothetical protein